MMSGKLPPRGRPAQFVDHSPRAQGFTLMELMIAVAIVGILAAIAYPSYSKSVAKTKRRAAQACLSSFATHMERYYTTNLSYAGAALPALECASEANTGQNYAYTLVAASLTASTYRIQAAPIGGQATIDAGCGTLSLDQAGARGVSGSDGADKCW